MMRVSEGVTALFCAYTFAVSSWGRGGEGGLLKSKEAGEAHTMKRA